MAGTTKIEWTDATWNPITGCTLVSQGCKHCYAAELAATRLKNHPSRAGLARKNAKGVAQFTGEVRFNEQWLHQPLRWRKPRMIFVCAHGDLFHEDVPDDWIDRVFAIMALCPQHTFQVLTKRPERMPEYMARLNPNGHHPAMDCAALMAATGSWNTPALDLRTWPLPNVWLGTSVEDQTTAAERIPHLLSTLAAVHFVSAEPLLASVDMSHLDINGDSEMDALKPVPWIEEVAKWDDDPETIEGWLDWYGLSEVPTSANMHPTLDWVIVGGESGPNARPMHPDWARSLRDQCAAAGAPFFFKQWGRYVTIYDREIHDPEWQRCDAVARDTPDGRWLNLAGGHGFHGEGVVRVVPTTKKDAGRLLDGVTHDGMPSTGDGGAL